MRTQLLTLSSLFVLVLASCTSDCYQYDVYAHNDTTSPITVEFKTWVDHTRITEGSLVLEPGDGERIICSFDGIDEIRGQEASKEHCSTIADYVRAKKNDSNAVANNVWCSDDVILKKTDYSQAEFHVSFKEVHFQ